MVWHEAEDELSRFLNIFGRGCVGDGSVYMQDSWTSRRAELEQRMKSRAKFFTADQVVVEPDRDQRFNLLKEAMCASYRMNAELYEQGRLATGDDTLFCDWEQHPKHGKSRPSNFVPCFLKHGTLVEHKSGRCLTLREKFAVHGWGTCRDDDFKSNVLDVMQKAGLATAGSKAGSTFIGNSMHIPSVMAVLLYAITHSEPRREAQMAAWRIASRSSSFSFEIGNETRASCHDKPEEASGSVQSQAGTGSTGRGRGLKRPAVPEVSASFRRAKSAILDD